MTYWPFAAGIFIGLLALLGVMLRFNLLGVIKCYGYGMLISAFLNGFESTPTMIFGVVTPIDLLMVKFTFYKRSNNLIVHLFAFRKTNGFSY
ncbi:hypothetical protein PDPUS_2_00741 [Photobacterium damselae subsp. piscicida]|uniref:Uncharacterized protein n=1 Tax=Photobacterium damsela subsp. piscicida TaxID=38294 RepID=A0A1V1VE01_PHODP|nr:hypothetical protein [Photobacterium damselae]MDP2531551.1 hypothetical protein [Photobacterium damselae subsp. piscicida]QOD54143.1 hypothetical protein IC628_18980 [Photobacterium damselae subsp. piscicida]QOD58360.1 hypothetical protein IC627_15700 [Photobacterium damselae subsp. piscicida]BAX55327.1 hypothetical protein PDPUS_2_00741 [Photobacterium damselae subsp. piscicida]GAW46284.1 hypothetical protein PDPJ_2_00534 [Photobacterium damselae subsp. piscicida]